MIYWTNTKILKEPWKRPETLLDAAIHSTLMNYGFKSSRNQLCNRFDNKTSYEKLGTAIRHCQRDDECVAIYDDDCDASGDLKLCKAVQNISDGVILVSCVYTKGPGKMLESNITIQTWHK